MMSNTSNHAMNATEWLLQITLSVLWGASFFFNEVALMDLPPLTIVFGRVGLAAIVLHAVLRAAGINMPREGSTWVAFFAQGLLNNLIPFSLLLWAQTQITSGLASILNATTPLLTVVLAHFLTREERLTSNRLGGTALGLSGVAVLIGPDAIAGVGLDVAAQLACLGAALSYALSAIFARRFKDQPSMVTATGQLTATTAMVAPLALIVDHPWTLNHIGSAALASVLGTALLSTAVAFTIYFRVLAGAGATNAMLVAFLIPVSTLMLGVLLLGEGTDPSQLAGMVLIACGLAFVDGRFLARFQRRGTVTAHAQDATEHTRQ